MLSLQQQLGQLFTGASEAGESDISQREHTLASTAVSTSTVPVSA